MTSLFCQFPCTGKSVLRDVMQRDLVAAQGKHRRNAASHVAGAHYG
jgi:hypothetical protein